MAKPRPLVLTGGNLCVDDVVRVARLGARVELGAGAVSRMRRARRVVERAVVRGEPVYGATTGVAQRKRVRVGAAEIESFNSLLIRNHRVGQRPLLPDEAVRAALLCIASGFARGTTAARPALAALLVRAINRRTRLRVRAKGSVGQSDLALNADLAHAVLGSYRLGAGEALALLNNNAFSTGPAALAVADATRLLSALEVAGALDLEAFAGNLSILDPAVDTVRPFPGVRASRARLAGLLSGSYLRRPGAARNLQDPLTFRGMPQLFGATREALTFVRSQLEIELNSADGNPLVVAREGRIVSVWNGETPLAATLDFLRVALAPVITSACERLIKLLQAPISGLTDGLAGSAATSEDGLAEFGVAAQSLAAEARLLAQPVSFELASTTQAEGIEDSTTMAPLAARRHSEMVELAERLLAIELVVAAQAIDLRGVARWLGRGTKRAYERIRERVAFTRAGEPVPQDLEPIREIVRAGLLSE
jgi:histidine ammonia-lyase